MLRFHCMVELNRARALQLCLAFWLAVMPVFQPVTAHAVQPAAPSAFCDTVTDIPLAECQALSALYYSTNGAGWRDNTGWLTSTTACTWYGITCSGGRISELELPFNLLNGSLPAGLSTLSRLTRLLLNNNQLTGSIPTDWGSLTSLTGIWLNNNLLTGSIPTQLGSLTSLDTLDLSNNQLNSSIPAALGSPSKLNYLYLANNLLSGSIPTELGNLTKLVELNLSGNQLTGSIPTSLGSIPTLETLDLHGNLLDNSIPTTLSSLSNLITLYLYDNNLSGSIPTTLGSLGNLEYMDLSGNQLTGSIPTTFGSSLPSLVVLTLSDNQLNSSIPTQLGSLSALVSLKLDRNALTGSIPTELGNLSNLEELDLSSNQLSGSIPTGLGNLANLVFLRLGSNQLTGNLPTQLGNLASLEELSLSSNQLNGSIPSQLGSLTWLTSLQLEGNALEGNIPTALTNLTNLSDLNIGYNRLSASGSSLISFLNTRDPDWSQTQTVPPTSLQSSNLTGTSVQLNWTPIAYTGDGGFYEISYSTTSGGALTVHGLTANKNGNQYTADNLPAGSTLYFKVRTYTPTHGTLGQAGYNQNNLWSSYTAELPVTLPAAPQASFTANPTSGQANLTVSFTNTSTGSYTSSSWTFGDGGTSTQTSPSHTYTVPGTYTVSLMVSGPGGTNTKTQTGYITVYAPVQASFTGVPTSGNAPLDVAFTNTSTGDYTSSSWTFGDGGANSQSNPTHTYANPGTYTVSLTISGPGGTDTQTRTNYIVVNEKSQASFTGTPTSGVAPLTVSFTNTSGGSYTGSSWTFGDGDTSIATNPQHTYTVPGIYTVSLTVNGPGGLSTNTKNGYIVVIAPAQANFTASPGRGPASLLVSFTNTSTGSFTTSLWDFGDGTTSTAANPQHTYMAPGTYTVTLTVSGPGGTSRRTGSILVVKEFSIFLPLTVKR